MEFQKVEVFENAHRLSLHLLKGQRARKNHAQHSHLKEWGC